MTVKQLRENLKDLDEDLNIVLLDLSNDGDGDGNVPLHQISEVNVFSKMEQKTHINSVVLTFES